MSEMVYLSKDDFEFILEAIKGALVEIELEEPNISQGVEDDLRRAVEVLEEGQ